jgi:hypothetical protein
MCEALEALSTIRTAGQVTLIDIYAAPFPDTVGGAPLDAALLAAVAPELIDRALAQTPDANLARGQSIYAALMEYAVSRIEGAP